VFSQIYTAKATAAKPADKAIVAYDLSNAFLVICHLAFSACKKVLSQ
jgi:hypothetical protein